MALTEETAVSPVKQGADGGEGRVTGSGGAVCLPEVEAEAKELLNAVSRMQPGKT